MLMYSVWLCDSSLGKTHMGVCWSSVHLLLATQWRQKYITEQEMQCHVYKLTKVFHPCCWCVRFNLIADKWCSYTVKWGYEKAWIYNCEPMLFVLNNCQTRKVHTIHVVSNHWNIAWGHASTWGGKKAVQGECSYVVGMQNETRVLLEVGSNKRHGQHQMLNAVDICI